MLPLAGGLYLGWALGTNDAGKVFGTAVAAGIINFRNACIICALAIILGAIVQGEAGIKTLSSLTKQTQTSLLVISISAAFTITLMTVVHLPISTSQAVIGSISGFGLATGSIYWGGLIKIVICWIATPIGAMLIALIVHKLLWLLIRKIPMSILTRDKLLWGGLIVVGAYASYALGANNVANATGIFSGQLDGITDKQLALFGGLAMAAGVVTYSRRVMMSVGGGIMKLDAFTAFVAVFSMAVTVHFFADVGVPVSLSQGITGAIMGIGLIRGFQTIKFRMLINIIGIGWLLTPAIALILSAAGYAVFCSTVK